MSPVCKEFVTDNCNRTPCLVWSRGCEDFLEGCGGRHSGNSWLEGRICICFFFFISNSIY